MSIYEKITSKLNTSKEKLAEFILLVSEYKECCFCNEEYPNCDECCEEHIVEWLEEEHDYE